MMISIAINHIHYKVFSTTSGYSLYKYTDGCKGRIAELSAPSIGEIQRYLAAAHRYTIEEVVDIFDKAQSQRAEEIFSDTLDKEVA